MQHPRLGALALLGMILVATLQPAAGHADGQRVIVTVNDSPITSFDIEQRLRLWQALGHTDADRKKAVKSLVDDIVKKTAAKKRGLDAKEDQVDKQIERMAKNTGTDVAGLSAKLKAKGVALSALKDYVSSQISFNRLLAALYQVKVEIDQAEVDREYQKIASDPRLKPVTAYEVMEIVLPVEETDEALMQQLLYARAVEASQIKQRFSGCGSARKAAEGVFNVVFRKPVEADPSKLPPPLKAALDQAGVGKLIGPARQGSGLQLIALCAKRAIAPPKPSRESVQTMLTNKKYDQIEERYMRDLRREAFIDYKDPTYSE